MASFLPVEGNAIINTNYKNENIEEIILARRPFLGGLDHAFAGPGHRPRLSMRAAANPVLVGQWPGYARGYAQAVAVTNNLAFIAAYSGGLIIMDVRNPSSPQRVGGYDTSGDARGVAVSGNYVYVADYEWGLAILQLSGGRNSQTIAFDILPDRLATNSPFNLTATASSGLPVSFRVVSGPAAIANQTVTLIGTGLVTIRAEQPGNDQYAPASQDRTFRVYAAAPPPIIVSSPLSRAAGLGSAVIFQVSATGTPPLSYQWRFNGIDLPGATNASLALANVQLTQAGEYSVVVSNAAGSATNTATLIVSAVWVGTPDRPIDGQFALRLHGETRKRYELLSSTNLVNWSTLNTFTAGDNPAAFTDSVTGVPCRFYRLREAP